MVARYELPQNASCKPKGGCDPNARCGNGLEKIYPTCAVRFGVMRHIGEFSYAPGMLFGCGNKVVVQTDRGIEIGEQVSLTCTGCEKSVSRDQMRDYAKNSGSDFFRLKAGRILRTATPADLLEERKLTEEAAQKLGDVRKLVRERGLPMKMVECEQIFGGERLIFYFMSEQRVDFRDVVRDLAHEYHTRIDMRQIGHRDEARLVADYEICGRECCCKNFLKTLRPVSMQMAKLQKSTLDPSKVSGRCGRLRCCLRYEHEGYEDLNKKLPRVGNRVRVESGLGTVVDRQVLTQLVMIELDSGRRMTYAIEDLLERDLPRPPQPTAPPANPSDRRPDSDRPGGPQRPEGRRRNDRPAGQGGGRSSDSLPGPARKNEQPRPADPPPASNDQAAGTDDAPNSPPAMPDANDPPMG